MCKVTKDKFSYCPCSWRKGEFERCNKKQNKNQLFCNFNQAPAEISSSCPLHLSTRTDSCPLHLARTHTHTHRQTQSIQSKAVMTVSNCSLWFFSPGFRLVIFKGEIALSLSFSVMNGSFIPHGRHLVSLLLFMPKTSGRLSFQLWHFLKVEKRLVSGRPGRRVRRMKPL